MIKTGIDISLFIIHRGHLANLRIEFLQIKTLLLTESEILQDNFIGKTLIPTHHNVAKIETFSFVEVDVNMHITAFGNPCFPRYYPGIDKTIIIVMTDY